MYIYICLLIIVNSTSYNYLHAVVSVDVDYCQYVN